MASSARLDVTGNQRVEIYWKSTGSQEWKSDFHSSGSHFVTCLWWLVANQIDADDAATDYAIALIQEFQFILVAVAGVAVLGCGVCGVWCLFRIKSQQKILAMQLSKISEGRQMINEDTAHAMGTMDTADTNQPGEGAQSGVGETNMIIPMFVSPPEVKSSGARESLVDNSGQQDVYKLDGMCVSNTSTTQGGCQ
eukprot:208870_1